MEIDFRFPSPGAQARAIRAENAHARANPAAIFTMWHPWNGRVHFSDTGRRAYRKAQRDDRINHGGIVAYYGGR